MKRFKSRRVFFPAVLLFFNIIFSSGCVYLIIGGLGAVGGYVVSPDTVEGVLGYGDNEIWDSAIEVIGLMGSMEERSDQTGSLIARINGSRVTINIISFSQNSTMLRVKARRSFFPRISVAQDVFIKIVKSLE